MEVWIKVVIVIGLLAIYAAFQYWRWTRKQKIIDDIVKNAIDEVMREKSQMPPNKINIRADVRPDPMPMERARTDEEVKAEIAKTLKKLNKKKKDGT